VQLHRGQKRGIVKTELREPLQSTLQNEIERPSRLCLCPAVEEKKKRKKRRRRAITRGLSTGDGGVVTRAGGKKEEKCLSG